MDESNSCRECFCGISLRTVTIIFGIIDVILWIGTFILLFHYNSNVAFKIIVGASGIVLIFLFVGAIREHRQMLRIFTSCASFIMGFTIVRFAKNVYCSYTESDSSCTMTAVLLIFMLIFIIIQTSVVYYYFKTLPKAEENYDKDVESNVNILWAKNVNFIE